MCDHSGSTQRHVDVTVPRKSFAKETGSLIHTNVNVNVLKWSPNVKAPFTTSTRGLASVGACRLVQTANFPLYMILTDATVLAQAVLGSVPKASSLMKKHAAVIVLKILGVKNTKFSTRKNVHAFARKHVQLNLHWTLPNANVSVTKYAQLDSRGHPTVTVFA